MLVLTRKPNEQLVIADGLITVTVVDIRGDKVRLGITAPRDISVHRKEVWLAIQKAGSRAQGEVLQQPDRLAG